MNYNFKPIIGFILISFLYWLEIKIRGTETEIFLLKLLALSYIFQVIGYLLNNFKVIDYIDLVVLQTNIPDLVIFFTLLTYLIIKAKSYLIKS